MSHQEPDKHEYDGIRELDNPMPRWWVQVFAATIVVGAFYWIAFQAFDEFRIDNEYAADLAVHRRKEDFRERLAAKRTASEATVSQKVEQARHDASAMVAGKVAFGMRCAMCHGDDGQGLVGTNLTDEYWLHGDGKPEAVLKVIAEGVDGKGMPPWKDVLSREQLVHLTAYVQSLEGTRPKNAKPPQGIAYKR